jgi:hypothetical protein
MVLHGAALVASAEQLEVPGRAWLLRLPLTYQARCKTESMESSRLRHRTRFGVEVPGWSSSLRPRPTDPRRSSHVRSPTSGGTRHVAQVTTSVASVLMAVACGAATPNGVYACVDRCCHDEYACATICHDRNRTDTGFDFQSCLNTCRDGYTPCMEECNARSPEPGFLQNNGECLSQIGWCEGELL